MKKLVILAAGLVVLMGSAATAKTQGFSATLAADTHRPAEETARDMNRKPAEMVAFAGVKPGDVVVDLVSAKGYFTRVFADAIGPTGHVYSFEPTEFDDAFKSENMTVPSGTMPDYPNVTYIHASIAKLPVPQLADVIWTSQNYHDLHDKFTGPVDVMAFNKAVYAALKPGGTFVILDHAAANGSGLRDTDTLHRIDPAVVKKEVTAAGFKFIGESKVLRNPADPHDKLVFDKSIRGHTDQFVYKFRKPR